MDTTDFGERSRTPEPCIIVIFGASGDLTNRKLMPALYNLFRKGGLPEAFCIVGVARTLMDDIAFRAKMRQGLANAGFRLSNWPEFEQRLHYHPVIYDDTIHGPSCAAKGVGKEAAYAREPDIQPGHATCSVPDCGPAIGSGWIGY